MATIATPRPLSELPIDILKMIFDNLTREVLKIYSKSDFSHLMKVCSSFHLLVKPWLYRSFDITFEYGVPSPLPIRSFLDAKNDGSLHVRDLQVCEIGTRLESRLGLKTDSAYAIKACTAAVFVELALQRIPRGRLRSFRWNLPLSIPDTLGTALLSRHPGIRNFAFMYLGALNEATPFPTMLNLQKIELPHLRLHESSEHIIRLLRNNPQVRKLAFDVKEEHLEAAEYTYRGAFGQEPDIWEKMCQSSIAESHWKRPKLKTLRLRKISVIYLCKAVQLEYLQSLTLHDCRRVVHLLDTWARNGDSGINLKKLRLTLQTQEGSLATRTLNSVEKFLQSFSGLKEFSILNHLCRRAIKEDRSPGITLSSFEKHAPSLETLVLHDFYHRHESPRFYQYPLSKDSLITLYKTFTSLKSLGISVDYSVLELNMCVLGLLAGRLRHIRILNTRLPDSPIKECLADANALAAASFRTQKDSAGGRLRLIIIGGDDYYPAQYFYIEKVRNVLGESVPIVTRLSEKKAIELEGPLTVTKQKWWFQMNHPRLHQEEVFTF